MNFNYTVKIEGKETIEFSKNAVNGNDGIEGVAFRFNSDDNTRDRDRNGRVEIEIYGKFLDDEKTWDAIRGIANWAKCRDDVYRKVTIECRTSEGGEGNDFLRVFEFDKMFCIDYNECYGVTKDGKEGDGGLRFNISLAQAPTFKIDNAKAERI